MATQVEAIACPLCQGQQHRPLISTQVQMQNSNETFQFVICEKCTLVFLNPRVLLSELDKFYPKTYLPYRGAEAWGKYQKFFLLGQKTMDRKRVRQVMKSKKVHKATKVLDVGCGKPSFLQELQKKTKCQAYGIDFKADGWADTQEFSNLNLQIGTIDDLDTRQEYDVITMWHYLEHDYTPQHTLNLLRGVSTPDTRLVIEVPNYDSVSRKKQKEYWGGYHTPRHTVLYTPETMRDMLERTGWEVVKIQSYGTMDPYIVWWLGDQDKKGIDWGQSMEGRFPRLMLGKFITGPLFALQNFISFGILLAVAKPK